MGTDFNNKQWGVTDFERYYSGKMPEAERHALEKAALDDPFLQDALDGYEFTGTPVADIKEIKERIWPTATNTPVIAIPWYKSKMASQLFKAAAVVIIFGGLGWLYINNKNNNSDRPDTQIASNEVKQNTKELRDSIQANLSQSTTNDSTPIVAILDNKNPESNIAEIQQNNVDAKTTEAKEKAAVEAEELARNEQSTKDKQAYNPAPILPKSNENRSIASKVQASKNRTNQISGRVVNQQGEPVANAVVRNNADSRQAVSSDQYGNFVMNNANAPSNSNAVPVEVNATGYERSNQNIANNSTNNTIVLNESQNNFTDLKEVDAKTSKKEKYEWNGRNSRIQLRNAKPLEGWDYFYYVMNDSISKNKQLMQHKGRLILTFNVNDSGVVESVAVKKSLNLQADSIASKIIQKSPVLELVNPQKKGEAVIKMY